MDFLSGQAPASFSKIIKTSTNIPFPAENHSTAPPSTINLSVCSEFLNYSAPVSAFSSGGKLGLVRDLEGQPIVFTIGDDKVSTHVQQKI